MFINGVEIPVLLTSAVEITQQAYDQLTDKTGTYIITDAEYTPLSASEVSYSSTVSGLQASNAQGAIDELAAKTCSVNVFNIATTSWVAYSDASYPRYTYRAVIADSTYANTSIIPTWDMTGAGDLMTDAEYSSANMVEVVLFGNQIELYATDVPTVALKLRVQGE